jgi:hypothetical protein
VSGLSESTLGWSHCDTLNTRGINQFRRNSTGWLETVCAPYVISGMTAQALLCHDWFAHAGNWRQPAKFVRRRAVYDVEEAALNLFGDWSTAAFAYFDTVH